ncbi:MAG: TetR/AcrR family transcriptional regulator [Peptococcaceae bacterium]|nr:TetR/AcrR family transcriptional regulator [Peptococcaceae bacterium]
MNTEQRIINAFKDLCLNQGFYAVRMEDLADWAGVGRRTIYLYFKNKEALVDKLVDTFLLEFPNRLNLIINESDPVTALAKGTEVFVKEGAFLLTNQCMKDLQTHYPVSWQKLETYRQNQVSAIVNILLERTEKPWVKELDPQFIREVIMAIERRCANVEFANEMGMSIKDLTLQFAKFIVYPFI